MLHHCESESGDELPAVDITPRTPVVAQPRSARGSRVAIEAFTPRKRTDKTLWQASLGHRDWSSGLLSCKEESCFSIYHVVCCPCLVVGSMLGRLGEPRGAAALPCVWPLLRTKIRTLGGVRGMVLGDCCASACCPCCSLLQMSRELGHMIVQPAQFLAP
ncbi:hypothetical protein MAR_016953 [Mya arenaria]|uniref:Uncharacterized protein n=1 Tax=Mya arenaria TaxID=6604 RepID=A0ABY7EAD4_MYAAR|nr:uncharacterized protein LOC128237136 [Mya arenaria]WAR06995.1 hypothetical protein MAR_016953 [Mya arenaria]